MSSLQSAFENAVPELIGAAWDFADHSTQVEQLWVYLSSETGFSVCQAYFQVKGEVCYAAHLSRHIDGIDSLGQPQDILLDRLFAGLNAMKKEAGAVDFPTRMILRYRPSDEDFTADFHYGPLQPGIPEEDQVTDGEVADHWFERLRTTGNDSATP